MFMYMFIVFMYNCVLLCICLCMLMGKTHNFYESARLPSETDFHRIKMRQLHIIVGVQVV